MKKNVMMRVASALLVAVLMTTCAISGTFAKYTTTASSEDSARVAYWGFQSSNSMDLTNLFLSSYTNVNSENGDDVIAPGTSGSTTFAFAYGENGVFEAPEVAYTFTVDVDATCDPAIVANTNIQWRLDGTGDAGWGTWNELIAAITLLSGDVSGTKQYAPNTLPDEFTTEDDVHTIEWRWIFAGNEVLDTAMGNDADLADCSIKITITATQVD